MKIYIVLFMVCGFAVNVMGGQPYRCTGNPCPNTWGIRAPNPTGQTGGKAQFAARPSRTTAYLNLRNATPISITEQDMLNVAWVTKEGFRFYGVKPSQGASGTTTLNYLEMSYFNSTALEVELLSFEGKNTQNGVDLTWTTASEKNNAGFEIERSTDGKTFETIGQVKGNGTTNVKNSYQFRAEGPLSITTYFRLKQTDFDRTSTTSNIISIAPKDNVKGIKIYPNPSSSATISLELSENTEGVSVINALGQVVFQQKTGGQNRIQLDISTWAKGLYFVKTAGNTEGVKFVKN